MYSMRTLSVGKFDDRGYSNEESIANLQLQKPVEINAFLTIMVRMMIVFL